MQIPFYTDYNALDFSIMNNEIFPITPERCPFKDCSMPVKLKKHGYYKRFFISKNFTGVLYIRRYICPICGRTVSFLPYFCISHFHVFSFRNTQYITTNFKLKLLIIKRLILC